MKNLFSISKRKGIVDVQFNWIFVMVAGFVLFLFIISIAFSQRGAAQKRSDILALNQIVTLLKDKQQSSDVYSEISFPKTQIQFRCEPTVDGSEGFFTLTIADADPISMSNAIIFAPRNLETEKMLVWSKSFETGFPVGVFAYVTSPSTQFIIYNPNEDFDDLEEELLSALPDNMTKNIVDDITPYRNNKNAKIICFSDPTTDTCNLDIDHIKIFVYPGQQSLFDYGNVSYHIKGDDTVYPYVSLAGLFGAIFSDSGRYYECQMSRAMKQLEIKRNLTQTRMTMIQNELAAGDCKTIINVTLQNDIRNMQNPVFNYENASMLGRSSRNLDIQNDKLILGSCPTIY